MIAKLSILSTAALALSPVFVAADSHDSLQRRHGHVGPNRLPMNNTFSLNTVSTNHTLDKRYDNARFTMYYQTGNAGACGIFNSDADFIVALNIEQYNSDWCFKMIEMSYGGKTAKAQIVDECPGCPWGALDCTPAIANYFGFFDDQVYGTWNLVGADTTTSSAAPPPPTTHKTSSTPPPPPKTSSKPHSTSSSSTWSPPPTSSPSSSSSHSSSQSSSSSSVPTSSSAATSSADTSSTAQSTSSTPSATPTSNLDQLSVNFVNMALLDLAAQQSN